MKVAKKILAKYVINYYLGVPIILQVKTNGHQFYFKYLSKIKRKNLQSNLQYEINS